MTALPQRLIAFYGDDFTGSTDVIEVVSSAGLAAVLFLEPPDAERLARFPEARVIGIAGISRSQTPGWMDENLPAMFASLRATGAPFVHYKVCSTFDSAPGIGSIGEAIRLGLQAFANRPVPLVVGAPSLRRYVAFGNLFAGFGDATYRIDRHPVMARHPVTPMAEGDLRLHLAGQADLSIGLIDLPLLGALDPKNDWLRRITGAPNVLLFDTVDETSLRRVGALLWSLAGTKPAFAVGSSGFEYALVAAWHEAGLLPPLPILVQPAPVERLFVLSGSCSPVTARQIGFAQRAGFVALRVDPRELMEEAGFAQALARSLDLLAEGRDVLLHTAEGLEDADNLSLSETERMTFNDRLGATLGRLLRQVVQRSGLRRVVIAGGDTSSHAVRELGLYALTFAAPLAPGCPLCHAHAEDPDTGRLEIALKGGQIGQDDFFLRAKGGAAIN